MTDELQPGQGVLVLPKCLEGEPARVARRDSCTGFYYVTLERHRGDPLYENYPFGPFARSELKTREEGNDRSRQ